MVNGRNGDYDFIRVHRGRKKLEKKGERRKLGREKIEIGKKIFGRTEE